MSWLRLVRMVGGIAFGLTRKEAENASVKSIFDFLEQSSGTFAYWFVVVFCVVSIFYFVLLENGLNIGADMSAAIDTNQSDVTLAFTAFRDEIDEHVSEKLIVKRIFWHCRMTVESASSRPRGRWQRGLCTHWLQQGCDKLVQKDDIWSASNKRKQAAGIQRSYIKARGNSSHIQRTTWPRPRVVSILSLPKISVSRNSRVCKYKWFFRTD